MSNKCKTKFGQRVTPLCCVTPVITTQTASDKYSQYLNACEQIKIFHTKWNELRFPKCGECDIEKVAKYEERIKGYIQSARVAKQDAALLGRANPHIQTCIARIKQYN